jgi:hypothetical protein
MAHYVRDLLADAVVRGFQGAEVLYNAGVITVRTDLPIDARSGPLTKNVIVPYMGNIGEAEDIPLTGAALTPMTIASDVEVAAVNRSGKAFFTEVFDRLSAAEDPYTVMLEQSRQIVARRGGKAMIDLASVPVAGNANLTDVYDPVTPRYYDFDVDIEAQAKFEDEVDDNGGVVLRIVHPDVWVDILKLKDADGRPLATEIVEGGKVTRVFNGIPTKTTKRLSVDRTNPAFPKYTSLLFKQKAGVFWVNQPSFDTDKDILSAADLAALHFFWVGHLYRHADGGTTPGWQVVRTNGRRPSA